MWIHLQDFVIVKTIIFGIQLRKNVCLTANILRFQLVNWFLIKNVNVRQDFYGANNTNNVYALLIHMYQVVRVYVMKITSK